jgi:hypothetical protein
MWVQRLKSELIEKVPDSEEDRSEGAAFNGDIVCYTETESVGYVTAAVDSHFFNPMREYR